MTIGQLKMKLHAINPSLKVQTSKKQHFDFANAMQDKNGSIIVQESTPGKITISSVLDNEKRMSICWIMPPDDKVSNWYIQIANLGLVDKGISDLIDILHIARDFVSEANKENENKD